MARSRNIKPGFFKNPEIAELSFCDRLLFIGLWTLADRDGYMEDRPKRIKMELFPADNVDVEAGLVALESLGFIVRYTVDKSRFLHVCKFTEHQHPHHLEKPSTIPKPETNPRQVSDNTQANPSDSLIPDSLIPDSLIPDSLIPDSLIVGKDTPSPVLATDGEFPTARGSVCVAMRNAGLSMTNPGDPRLQALIDSGATVPEFEYAATEAVRMGKGWGYALKIVENRRIEAAKIRGSPGVTPIESAAIKRDRERTETIAELTGGRASAKAKNEREAIDGQAVRVG
jgi:hypothetical protein